MKNRQQGVRDNPGTNRTLGRGGAPAAWADIRRSPGGREIFQLFHGIHQREPEWGPLLPWQTSGLWMTISICNKSGFQFKRSGSLGKSSPEWGAAACLFSAETQQKAWASSKCSRSGKHFLLAGFLTSPVVFFQQKQEKGRIHLNLMLKYPQKDEAKGTVRSRDRVEIKNTFFLSLSLAHTLYMYIAWSCAIQENNFWRRQYKSGWKGKNKKEDESGLLCLSEPRGSLPGAPDRFFQER